MTPLQLEFFQASERVEKARKRQRNLVLLGLSAGVVLSTTFGLIANQNAQEAKVQTAMAEAQNANPLLASNKQFDALVVAVKAGKQIQKVNIRKPQILNLTKRE